MEWLASLFGGIFGEALWEGMPSLLKFILVILILLVIVLIVIITVFPDVIPTVIHMIEQKVGLEQTNGPVEVIAYNVPDGIIIEVHNKFEVEMARTTVEFITNKDSDVQTRDQPPNQPVEIHFPIGSSEPQIVIVRVFALPEKEMIFEREYPIHEILK